MSTSLRPHCLFPEGGLPAGIYPPGETLEWLHGDTRKDYRRRGGHPVYGEHDIRYRFNALGYRCEEFDRDAEIRIVAIGCSYVFGIGLAQEHLFHERFAARVRIELSRSVVVWNLASSGTSNDYISRLLLQALPLLDPHLVLVNFTHLARREYVSVRNRMVKYLPSHAPDDASEREIHSHFQALTSPYDDELNYFRNYKTIENAVAGRRWLYSGPEWHPTPAYADQTRFVGLLQAVDRARDGDHPGPTSHHVLASLYWNRFVALGDIEALSRG
ncbi:hypothetical protein ACIBQX_38765 [Nonomuraea sp. NPDC049714]|uniref:hypothetical protein n=1 Tax=Nonomuraea sp. NPDC049714 TaxID=3364357 RepID=UPI0037B87BAB